MEILNVHKHGKPNDAIYIGRGSPLGNLKVIGKDGTRPEVIAWYRDWLKNKIFDRDPNVIEVLRELRDNSKLLCFCVPQPCHGEVIKEYWEEINKYEDFDSGINGFINKHNTGVVFDPVNDGKTHINIYSKGHTELGRLLSNFSNTPFVHPSYGSFQSVEGFWYWLGTGKVHDELKNLSGFQAKNVGRQYQKVEVSNFYDEVKKAIWLKLEQNPKLKQILKESTLPFSHYYYYGDARSPKIIYRKQDQWLVDFIEAQRSKLNPDVQIVN